MSTMKTRLRARLEPLELEAGLRDRVIEATLEELERPSQYMLDRGRAKIREEGMGLEEAWAVMIQTAAEGG